MAKGNLFLGAASGSIGDVTFYRKNAQQISRMRVRKVKNPQSPAQMGQRAINHTAVQAYSVLKGICDHSFQGVSYGANSYAKFLSLNMDMLRQEAATTSPSGSAKSYLPFGFEGLVAMPFILSKGSLPSIPARFYEQQSETPQFVGVFLATGVSPNPANVTYADIISKLNAQQGDQLTIIRIPNPVDGGFPDEPLGRSMILARVILDPGSGNDPAETSFFDMTSSVGVLRVNDPNPRNEGNAIFQMDAGNLIGSAGVGFVLNDFAFAAILSRQAPDGSWLRSDSILVYDETWRENGYTLKQASTLSPVDVYIENDYYLNNAE